MAYYDALKAKWATLTSTTTDAKLAEINALTVAGPNVDVPVSTVVGTLMLSGGYLALATFSQSGVNSNQVHDTALGASKLLMTLITTPNAPVFNMSDDENFTIIKTLMDAILAQENATQGSTGFTQAVHDKLLALAATTVPWWQANGYTSSFNSNDLVAAGGLT